MLKIRLQRVGRKHEPTFRVVLTDSKNSTKSGRFTEILGSYDPRKKTEVFAGDRIKEWMGKGAQVSGTLHNLLVSHKIIDGKKLNVLPHKKPFKSEKKLAEEKAAADALAAKEAAEKAEAEAAIAKEAEDKAAAEAAASTPVEEVAPVTPEDAPTEATPEPIAEEAPKDEVPPTPPPVEADQPVESTPEAQAEEPTA